MNSATIAPDKLTTLSYTERARAIAPIIAEHAAEGEANGAMPDAVVQAMRDAELFWMLVDPELGGGGIDVLEAQEVFEIIGAADGSASWALMATSVSTWNSALFYPGFRQLFLDGKKPVSCGTSAPIGTAVQVEGGYRVNAPVVPFGSGLDAADWVGTTVRILDEDGNPVLRENGAPLTRAVRAPKSETTVHDDWDVMGLAATGSYSYGWVDYFIPEEFTYDSATIVPAPGEDHHGETLDLMSSNVIGHGGVVLGIMRRALHEVATIVEGKRRLGYAVPVEDYAVFKKDFVEADANFWAIRGYFYKAVQDGMDAAAKEHKITVEQMARIRQATTHLHTVATDIILFAGMWGGTQTLRNPSDLGRALRDMMVARNHALVDVITLDNAAEPIIESWR